MHRSFGGMKVDFAKVASRLDSGADIDTSNPTDALPTDPVLVGSCSSDMLSDGGHSVQLTPLLGMHWILNTGIGSSIARSGSVATVTIVLEYRGTGWLGFGISNSLEAHGPGSVGIVGTPSIGADSPLLFSLKSNFPMTDQLLLESNITEIRNRTTLWFTKALNDGNGPVIKSNGLNYFSFAVGAGTRIGPHLHHGVFQMELSQCYVGPPPTTTKTTAAAAAAAAGTQSTDAPTDKSPSTARKSPDPTSSASSMKSWGRIQIGLSSMTTLLLLFPCSL